MFSTARYHPSGAVEILRTAGNVLILEPGASAQQVLDRCATGAQPANLTVRALTAFFASLGRVLLEDASRRRAGERRQRYLSAIPAGLRPAVAAFDQEQLEERERQRRAGQHQLSDITLAARLRILRDLATHVSASRRSSGWAEVSSGDVEAFLAQSPANRHQQTYVLRRFFRWAKQRKLILASPAQGLRLGAQPGFTSPVLDITRQRTLFARWTTQAIHPHERFTGLLALLHAASNQETRVLQVRDIDQRQHNVHLPGRPFPTPLEPATWEALEACLRHREDLHTFNPHVIVTGQSRTCDAPASSSYLTRALRSSGTTPSACRQTRIAQLVTDLDPKLTATILGMHDGGLVRYLADNVDQDRLQPTSRN